MNLRTFSSPLWQWSLWARWLWLVPYAVMARDPFSPAPVVSCPPALVPGWRVTAMIGQGERFYSWLRQADGRVVRLRPGDPFPVAGWSLQTVRAFSITLATFPHCRLPMVQLHVKGTNHAKDSALTATVDQLLPGQ